MNECQIYRLCYVGSPNCSFVKKAFFGKFLINAILTHDEDYLKIHLGDFGRAVFCVNIL